MAAAARITVVDAGLAAETRILPEADIFEALRLAATIADGTPTGSRERASLGVDHATQRAGLPAGIGQTPTAIDPLTEAVTVFFASTRTLRPDRGREHRATRESQNGRPKLLKTSIPHDFLLL
jgi:hypothetical protein